jgi:hypothetical protein
MKKHSLTLIIGLILTLSCGELFAQIDSLHFKSGEFIIGEIKSMDKGILKVETDYSDSDFQIEWDKLISLKTTTQFMIMLSDGRKYYGTMKSTSDTTILLLTKYEAEQVVSNSQIISMVPFDDKFLDRLSANISLGFDLAKAKNLQSLTTRSSLGYRAEKWDTDLSFYALRSTQDSVEDIQRTEAALNFRYILPRRFYTVATVSGLSNTEQKLDLRVNAQLGLGNFLVQTGSMYWGAKLGVNRNIENYSNETNDKSSWEGYLGTEVNLFDMGDVSMLFLIMAYPSITEPGRLRTDSKLDFKYELPLDFYINLGISLNSDNRPAEDAGEIDYVLYTGFGWEW